MMSIRALIEAQLPTLEGEERRRAEMSLANLVERDPGDYPPLLEQAGNAIGAAGRAMLSGFARVDRGERDRRLVICKTCPEYDPERGRCRRCGCVARWKAILATERCPIGKW